MNERWLKLVALPQTVGPKGKKRKESKKNPNPSAKWQTNNFNINLRILGLWVKPASGKFRARFFYSCVLLCFVGICLAPLSSLLSMFCSLFTANNLFLIIFKSNDIKSIQIILRYPYYRCISAFIAFIAR